MSTPLHIDARSPHAGFVARCGELHLPLWRFDCSGHLHHRPDQPTAIHNWLRAPSLENRIAACVRDAMASRNFDGRKLFDGCHALPLAEGHTEQPIAIDVVLFFTPELFDSQPFHEICAETGLSARDISRAMRPLLCFERGDLRAAFRMLQWSHTDACAGTLASRTLNEFSERLIQSYEEINMLFRLARLLNCTDEPVQLMQMFCGQLQAILPFRWVAIRFNARGVEVPELVGRLVLTGSAPCHTELLDRELVQLAEQAFGGGFAGNAKKILKTDADNLARLVQAEVLVERIVHDDRVVGILLAGNKQGPDAELSSFETQFIAASAQFLSVLHENLAREAEQRSMFMGTLHALTASIDAKDPYTLGHSERVAALAVRMAERLNLSKVEIERYRVAGMVHDVGKIGVPEAVLCKPGRLTDEEFAMIKQHPVIGERILRGIAGLKEIVPGVLHHHERWDGGGYPHRLAGENIPFLARVLALADTFDAMSSDRSYRPRFPRDRVLAEIARCSGSQFDPNLAPIFASLDFTGFDDLLARSQQTAKAA